jgi:hypothetical protein
MKKKMTFELCIAAAEYMIAEAKVPARRVVAIANTRSLRITKLVLDDSNLILTCSRPDEILLVTKSTPADLHLIR